MPARILTRAFYNRPTIEVARDLLGKVLVHGERSGIIVETEAYLGGDDLASHTARGITPRTKVIFGPPGHAYIYLIYGMYRCLNLVADTEGTAGCVLIRALEPLSGVDTTSDPRPASGPGKLTRALGIAQELNGADVTRGELVVRDRAAKPEILVTPRIGITKCADLPLRFVIAGNQYVSGRAVRSRV